MDISNHPPDMCPLCRQRSLSLDGTVLDCSVCHAKAEFDVGTRRIRYTSVPKRYEQFEAALQEKWLSRAEAFEATELKPLPAVVFFPVIVSLLALCALFGLIGVVLAVRPGANTTRQIIEDAYARQFGLQAVSPESPTLTVTVQLTTIVEVTLTAKALSPEAAGTATAMALALQLPGEVPTATPPVGAPPPGAVPSPQVTQPVPEIPTPLPPTFTPLSPANEPPAPPTPSATVPSNQTPTVTATPVQQSPLPVPGTPTSTATANPANPTPTSTNTVAPNQLGPVIVTGSVAITNVNAAVGTAFDEYLDIYNTSANVVTLVDWKIRVGGQVYNLSNPPGTQIQLLQQRGCRVYTGTNVGPVALPGEYNECGAKFLGITSGTKIYPNTTGYQIELLNESNVVVAYYGR